MVVADVHLLLFLQSALQDIYYLAGAQACAAADQLKGNLDSEFVAVRDFIAAFCRCMDYVQHARMLVVGYPFTPDVLAITNLVRSACCLDAEA